MIGQKSFFYLQLWCLLLLSRLTQGLVPTAATTTTTPSHLQQQQSRQPKPEQQPQQHTANDGRRTFLVSGIATATAALLSSSSASSSSSSSSLPQIFGTPPPAWAAAATATSNTPLISTKEFGIILRDSAQAVRVVEFSGPQSETVTVRLTDGTSFGLNDVVESSVDPRSPLKIAAMCRENRVPTKFLFLEAALASAPKRKVLYTNERVLEAAEKEKAKKVRIQQDEEDRLAELFKMQQQE